MACFVARRIYAWNYRIWLEGGWVRLLWAILRFRQVGWEPQVSRLWGDVGWFERCQFEICCRCAGFVARDCLFRIRKGKSPQAVRMHDRGEFGDRTGIAFWDEGLYYCVRIRMRKLWHVMVWSCAEYAGCSVYSTRSSLLQRRSNSFKFAMLKLEKELLARIWC